MQVANKANKIPEKVIVELIFDELEYQRDAELPAHMPIGDLRRGLLSLLKQKEPRRFSKVKNVTISYRNTLLTDDKTLAEVGAWDGSVLELKKSGDESKGKYYWG